MHVVGVDIVLCNSKKRSDRYPKPNGYSLGAGAGAGIKYYPLSFVSAGRV